MSANIYINIYFKTNYNRNLSESEYVWSMEIILSPKLSRGNSSL